MNSFYCNIDSIHHPGLGMMMMMMIVTLMMISRVRAENMRLRWEIEKQKQDEERYIKLQCEVEHMRSRLHKVTSPTKSSSSHL